MRNNLKIIPNAKKQDILKINEMYKIHLTSQSREGKANKELIDLLSRKFKAKKSKIKIIKGEKSRNKVVEIVNQEINIPCSKLKGIQPIWSNKK